MPVVIDEMESTVEPEPRHEPGGGEAGGQPQSAFANQQLAAQLARIMVRSARLKAD